MEKYKVKLNNGHSMPAIGLGTWRSSEDNVKEAVRVALETGYRHIDTAAGYANEQAIGESLAECLKGGLVNREDLFITTKLFPTHMAKENVGPAFEDSLTRLGLDFVDLYLIHWPFGLKNKNEGLRFPVNEKGEIEAEKYDLVETWKAMEDLVQAGKVRSIGVSNFNSRLLARICENATIMPVTNQVECHIYLQQRPLREVCSKKGILLTAACPLGSPDSHSPTENTTLPLNDPVVMATAEKLQRTPAQVLIRYQLQRDMAVIPKSVTPSRIKANFKVFDFELSEDDMLALSELDRNLRFLKFTDVLHCHPEYPREDLL